MDYTTWPTVVVVDVEGNGANPPDLVEVATIPVVGGHAQASQAVSHLICPPGPITRFATDIHGLTDAAVASCPPWIEIAEQVRTRLDGVWIAAHNAIVDYRVLSAHLPGWAPAGVIDTLRLARAVYPDAARHTLDAMITHAAIDLSAVAGQRHRAGYDAHAAALLLLALAEHYDTFDALTSVAVPTALRTRQAPHTEEPTLW